MFDDYTLAGLIKQSLYSYSFSAMDDNFPPSSSRESSPSYDSSSGASSRRYPTTSIAELSQHFDRQTLTPQRTNILRENLIPRAGDHTQTLHPPSSSFSSRVYRQRQSLNRLSRISALVEDMVQTGLPTYDPTHPDPLLSDNSSTSPSLSPDEQEPLAESSYFGFTSLPSSSAIASATGAYGLAQHILRHSHSYKINKDLRHSASRDGRGMGMGGQRMVKKKIRMRKCEKN